MELREELEELENAADPDAAIAQFEAQIKQLDKQQAVN